MISFPYEISEGARYHTDPIPAGSGLTGLIIETREPLLVRTADDMERSGAIRIEDRRIHIADPKALAEWTQPYN